MKRLVPLLVGVLLAGSVGELAGEASADTLVVRYRDGGWRQHRSYHDYSRRSRWIREEVCDPWPIHHSYSRRPVVVAPDDTVVINVPNDNGSYTPVTLRRMGGSYVGPRGEYYITLPTVDQLKAVYGLK